MKRTRTKMTQTDLDQFVSDLHDVFASYEYTTGVSFDDNTLTINVGANQYSRAIAQDCWDLISDCADGSFNVEFIEYGQRDFIPATSFPVTN